jgi:hypothetical protein
MAKGPIIRTTQFIPLNFVPHKITNPAILVYLAALLTISVIYSSQAMYWYWWVFGILEVVGFFYFANRQSRLWANIGTKQFQKNVFWTACLLRVVVMLFLYWFHNTMTEQPFAYGAADEIGYHEEAKWMAQTIRDGQFSTYLNYKFVQSNEVSDAGYPMYLGFVYLLSGDSIIVARLLKCLWGALSCLLIYRLGKRNFGEHVGRLAAILMMLEPHFYIYGSLHLKETEMIFMMILFLERTDNLVRSRNFNFSNIAVVVLLLASLFTFRTVLGLTAVFSIVLALLLTSKRVMSWSKRIVFLLVFGATALYFAGGRIFSEIEQVWELKDDNQSSRMSEIVQTQSLAQYAGAAVFAPMIFTIPFPTMVETEGQETSRLLHGGMVVKNIMSYFCIIALISLLFPLIPGYNKWRDHVLIGVFLLAYLMILVFSAFAHADRFHLPALALEVLFMAYGVSLSRIPQMQRWYKYWLVLMFVAIVAWNWFKLAGRGMI